MQHHKVQNLRIVADRLDGLLLRPGEQFSFCRLVGRARRRKGYLDGMVRHNEIWRDAIDRRTGNRVDREPVKINRALVKYVPS